MVLPMSLNLIKTGVSEGADGFQTAPESYPPSKPSAVSPASALNASSMPKEPRGMSMTSPASTLTNWVKPSSSLRVLPASVGI